LGPEVVLLQNVPTRLIHLADYVPAYSGSFVPLVREALVRAQRRGWQATAVFPEAARDRDWAHALANEVELAFTPPSRAGVAALLDDGATTILHTHFTTYDLPAAAAARGRPSVHLVWQVHGSLPREPSRRLRSTVKYTLTRHLVDAIVCVGPHAVGQLVRSGASRRRTRYLPNGIDTSRFRPPSADARKASRAALGFPDDRPVVLQYGWSWHIKGGDLFCAAIGELRARGVEVTAVTVGAGPEAVADSRRFGIEDQLICLPQGQNVEQLLAASDVFALPSRAEGGNPPFSVLEALATGVPVVAGDIPGQTLGNQLDAYRAVPLEPSALADAIETQLATTDEERATARSYVESERSLAAWADRMDAVYDAILAERLPS
jgi:glycosyltransferase involved in cell wall biosynthesis